MDSHEKVLNRKRCSIGKPAKTSICYSLAKENNKQEAMRNHQTKGLEDNDERKKAEIGDGCYFV